MWKSDGTASGTDTIGVFRSNRFLLDVNGDGTFNTGNGDLLVLFGSSGDLPVVGDWNGDGADEVGVYRGNEFFLDVTGDGRFGVGDVRFVFGQNGDRPIAGDWNNDGQDEVGVQRGNQFLLDFNGDRILDTAHGDLQVAFGQTNNIPLIGRWRSPVSLLAAGVSSNGPAAAGHLEAAALPSPSQIPPITAAASESWVANDAANAEDWRTVMFEIVDSAGRQLAQAIGHALASEVPPVTDGSSRIHRKSTKSFRQTVTPGCSHLATAPRREGSTD